MRVESLLISSIFALGAQASTTVTHRDTPAPLYTRANSTITAGKYIIKLKPNAIQNVLTKVLQPLGHDVDHVFDSVFHVEYVEQEGSLKVAGTPITQEGSEWALSRISHRNNDATNYIFDSIAGEATCAYVIYTGLDDVHPGFEGRAKQIALFIKDQTTDGSGHDTHVAGVIGSRRFGVAKKINIYGIKVVDKNTGRSLNSDTIKAMELVVKDSKKRNCPKGVVVNMSLGGEYSQAMNDAVETLVSTNGIFVAVSAGNENQNASNFSPASAPWACTVGATTYDDTRYTESNWGKAVKIMAPGVSVLSLRPNKRTVYMTGTSMVSPHVAGLAAYFAAKDGISGYDLCNKVIYHATVDAISDQTKDTVNWLAFNGISQ